VFFKEGIIGPLKTKITEIRHFENRHDVIFLSWVVRLDSFADGCRITCRLRLYGRNRNRV